MIKTLKSIVLVFLLTALPTLVFAQATDPLNSLGSYQLGGVTINPSFTPVITDLSVNYLGQIFGTVGTVLHGTSGQMLGQLFKVFNIGILVLAGIFLIYTIAMTVLNTAHEGEFMGRKWNSAWIAIRTVLGLGLLVPSMTTGYSAIQVIVMWVVIQGAGFANMAWYSALNYIAQGGQLYTPPATDTATMVDLAGTVMEMQVCMYSAQSVEQTAQQNQQAAQQQQQQQQGSAGANTNTASPSAMPEYIPNFTPLFVVFQDPTKNNLYNSVVKFPGNKYETDGAQDNACGQISFGTNADPSALASDQKVTTLKAAVRQMMMDMDSYAKQIANPTQGLGTNSQNFPTQVQAAIVGAAADWVNITLPIRSSASGQMDSLMAQYAQNAIGQGWIMAGRYYYALGSIQRTVSDATSVTVNIDQQPAGFPNSTTYISFANLPAPSPTNMGNLLDFSANDKQNLVTAMGAQGVASYVNAARTVAQSVDQAGQVSIQSPVSGGILEFLLEPLYTSLTSALQLFSTATGDPLIVVQNIGYMFMIAAGYAWISGTVGMFALGTASSVLSSVQPVGYGVEDAIFTFVPTFTAFILIFFVLGASFAYYIPLIPFIIFVFSAIGWLIAVIEAMVAAPLVALGITHPEGHDLLGKSEQAIMLLLSVFLRPVLMVIGLIAGMILSRVVLRFLNSGFFGIVFEFGNFNVFAFLAMLVVYCMLLISIVNQSFALIYVIPDRVMRWLGVTEQSTHAQEALQGSKQGFEQVSGGVERLGGGVSQGAASSSEKALKRGREEQQLNKGDTSATGGGGGAPPAA